MYKCAPRLRFREYVFQMTSLRMEQMFSCCIFHSFTDGVPALKTVHSGRLANLLFTNLINTEPTALHKTADNAHANTMLRIVANQVNVMKGKATLFKARKAHGVVTVQFHSLISSALHRVQC
jgi:hypothetical protein